MNRYEVWTIIPRPKDKQIIPLKWVFTIKPNKIYKARLVTVECRDKERYSRYRNMDGM